MGDRKSKESSKPVKERKPAQKNRGFKAADILGSEFQRKTVRDRIRDAVKERLSKGESLEDIKEDAGLSDLQ